MEAKKTTSDISAPGFRPEVLPIVAEILRPIPGVESAKSFGLPGFRIGTKFFAVLHGAGVALKLPKERATSLKERGLAGDFSPMGGRVMKEWVLITHQDPEAYKQEAPLFDEAVAFVATLVK